MGHVPSFHSGDETKATTFGLLDLPPELWSSIVELAVTEDAPVEYQNNQVRKLIHFKEPTIARTCRTLRVEARKLFYAKNEFFFTGVAGRGNEELVVEWMKQRFEDGHWGSSGHVLVHRFYLPGAFEPVLGRMFPTKKVGEVLVRRRGKKKRMCCVTVEDMDGEDDGDSENSEDDEGAKNGKEVE